MIPDMNLKVSLMESDVSEVGGREAFCRKLSNYDICPVPTCCLSSQRPVLLLILPLSSILHQYYFNCFDSEFELTKGRLCACTMQPAPSRLGECQSAAV